jgi:hypothetical protein
VGYIFGVCFVCVQVVIFPFSIIIRLQFLISLVETCASDNNHCSLGKNIVLNLIVGAVTVKCVNLRRPSRRSCI